jgi:hypothetical protein
MNPAETMMRDALAAWEKAASKATEQVVRDPRMLELGSSMLKLGLAWKKTLDQMVTASFQGGGK